MTQRTEGSPGTVASVPQLETRLGGAEGTNGRGDGDLEEALRRQHERFERVFETVPLMMTIYDPSTKVLRVNPAFARLVGWSSDELSGISLMEQCYPDPEYREQAREYMQACRPEWRDFRVTTRSGGVVVSSWTNLRLSDETQLGIGIDLTDRERAEEKLRRSEERLRHANRLKDEFLAVLAHELRNPLAAMHYALELLREGGEPPGDGNEFMVILDRQLRLLVRLVDDLLDASRINTGKIDLRRDVVELEAVLYRAIASSYPHFQANQLRLVIEHNPGGRLCVDGDATRLEQVFANLLHNAAKFTPGGGSIHVTMQPEGGEAIVRVADSGVGMSADFVPRVFEMFAQADRTVDRARDGLGIGLSLVKHLVELHGGSVEASSAGPSQGSVFVVRLPLSSAPEGHAAEKTRGAPANPAGVARRKVLVVDDNVDAAATLASLLGRRGHHVSVAHDGAAGIELARSQRPDAIVLDLGMPGMSGYTVASRIRADPDLRGVLLIALTGWDQGDARLESALAGFDYHLVKPVAPAVLADVLASSSPGGG
jgi:two-component system CheB/CheR fusion protein